ncbi:MAG: hypothetical protein ACE5GV_17545 [Candidatus Scalindua sp.]
MKKILVIPLFLVIAGCASYYSPVTSMSNYDLQNEYNNLRIEQKRLERILTYGGTGYKTTYDPGFVDSSGFRWTNPTTNTTPNTRTINQLTDVEMRMHEIDYELSRRSQMGYTA